MPPPPAEPLAHRIVLGPALRAQPDRRLVKLVREGYEAAFEEIVRRYRKPLDRFAAALVGGRAEDVTQDAFSKALLALRGSEGEIELRPWLYRIVRNTALNELRDSPPAAAELSEGLPGGRSAAAEAERREEMAELVARLRALPEPQRAAIVMRELEGLSHEEIAAALGVSGGAARQAIHRARTALRDALGLLVPLPLLRLLFEHGAEAAGAGGAVAAAGGGAAAAGGGAALGGLGAGGAAKVGVATVLLAGSVGAGVALQDDRGDRGPERAGASLAAPAKGAGGAAGPGDGLGVVPGLGDEEERRGPDRGEDGDDRDGREGEDREDRDGRGGRGEDEDRREGRGEDRDRRDRDERDEEGRGHGGERNRPEAERDDGERRSGRSGDGSGRSGGAVGDRTVTGSGSRHGDDDSHEADEETGSGSSGSGSSGGSSSGGGSAGDDREAEEDEPED